MSEQTAVIAEDEPHLRERTLMGGEFRRALLVQQKRADGLRGHLRGLFARVAERAGRDGGESD